MQSLVLAHFRSFSASPAVCGPPNGCGGCDLRAWVPPTRYRAIRQGTKPGKVVLLAGASLPLGLLAGVRSRGLARTAVGASDPPTPTRPQGSSGRVASSATRALGPPAASRRGPSGAGVSFAPIGPPAGDLNPTTAFDSYALAGTATKKPGLLGPGSRIAPIGAKGASGGQDSGSGVEVCWGCFAGRRPPKAGACSAQKSPQKCGLSHAAQDLPNRGFGPC